MDARLSLQQMRVLIALYTFRNKNTEMAHPTRQEISERTGMALTKISTATTDLERLGWLTKIGNGGRSQATRYRVHVPETITESGTIKRSRTVTERGTVNGRKTVPEQGTVADPVTVTDSVTVTESETVTDSARNGYRIGNETVPDSGRGKEQTIQTRTDQKVRRASARSTTIERPADVPASVWQDFQAIRKAKRAPLTNTALSGIRREAGKAGISLADAIAYCCEAGWQGFNAGWYADRHAGGGRRAAPESFRERDRRAAAERVAQFSPRIADRAALSGKPTLEVPDVLAVEGR